MYGKHFESMYTGSMVGIGAIPFAVWGYVISHQKPPKFEVELNPKILATIIGESEDGIQKAIERFCEPDVKSRTDTNEGRKLVRLGEYLFHVVNGAQYDSIRNHEDRKAYWREQKQKKRSTPELSTPVHKSPRQSTSVRDNELLLQIYNAYPRKVARKDALAAIEKSLKKITPEKLLELTKQYANAIGTPDQFTPHPATWFNGERFNDDPKTWKPAGAAGKPNPRNFGIVGETIYEGAKPKRPGWAGKEAVVDGEASSDGNSPPAIGISAGSTV